MPIELGDSWFTAKPLARGFPLGPPEKDSTGSDRSRTPSGAGSGRTGPGRQGRGPNGEDPHAMGKVPQRGLSDGKEASEGCAPPGTAVGWAWKQPSPKDCVTAQRRGLGPSAIRGSKPPTEPSCPTAGGSGALPPRGGEVPMLTRVAETVRITVVRRPRVPPAGSATEGHSVPHTSAWREWTPCGGSPETSTPVVPPPPPRRPRAPARERGEAPTGRGPYPKPTPVGRPTRLGPRANHAEGTRQISSVP